MLISPLRVLGSVSIELILLKLKTENTVAK